MFSCSKKATLCLSNVNFFKKLKFWAFENSFVRLYCRNADLPREFQEKRHAFQMTEFTFSDIEKQTEKRLESIKKYAQVYFEIPELQ